MMASPGFTGSLPEMYERFLVAPVFRPFAQALLDRVGVTDDDRLLDVACGTGIVARLARETIGDRVRVVGIDASPGMIAMAKSVAPSGRLAIGAWRAAEEIPLMHVLQQVAETHLGPISTCGTASANSLPSHGCSMTQGFEALKAEL
jgi:trans-aconitate methyltransferase